MNVSTGRPVSACATSSAIAMDRACRRPCAVRGRRHGSGCWAPYFIEGDAARCRADPLLQAYTVPGSRVVWICGDRFAERFAIAVRDASYLVIHEMLHTAGLGENPPSSAEVTAVVARMCGR